MNAGNTVANKVVTKKEMADFANTLKIHHNKSPSTVDYFVEYYINNVQDEEFVKENFIDIVSNDKKKQQKTEANVQKVKKVEKEKEEEKEKNVLKEKKERNEGENNEEESRKKLIGHFFDED